MDGWVGGWMGRWMGGWVSGWMDEWMGVRLDGWDMIGWNGFMDERSGVDVWVLVRCSNAYPRMKW